jgi:hypothetical protein
MRYYKRKEKEEKDAPVSDGCRGCRERVRRRRTGRRHLAGSIQSTKRSNVLLCKPPLSFFLPGAAELVVEVHHHGSHVHGPRLPATLIDPSPLEEKHGVENHQFHPWKRNRSSHGRAPLPEKNSGETRTASFQSVIKLGI